MFGHNRAGWQVHARPNENSRPTHGKRRRTRLVSQASQISRGKNAIIRAGKSSEHGTGDFHACLYSLRDHPHGSDWSRRLLGAPRKGRCPRALEARLNGAEISSYYFFSACLSLRQSQPRPSFLSRGFLRVCLPTNPRAVLCITHAKREMQQPARSAALHLCPLSRNACRVSCGHDIRQTMLLIV